MSDPSQGEATPAEKPKDFLHKTGILSRSEIIPRMNREMAKDDPNFDEILNLIRQDSGLTHKAIAIANSAWFGGRLKVDTVQIAFGRMGLKDFYRAVLAAALRAHLAEGTEQNRWWQHAELTARCCQAAAQQLAPGLVEKAFLAGLLHDCAVPLMAKELMDYSYLADEALSFSPTILSMEQECYQLDHCEVGVALIGEWQFPAFYKDAVQRHHTPLLAPLAGNEAAQLLALLLFSKRICAPEQAGGIFADGDEAILLGDIAETLEVSAGRMTDVLPELLKVYHPRQKNL